MDFRKENECKVKKGLLFLKDCGKKAKKSCEVCNRPVCSEHRLDYENKIYCPECAEKQKIHSSHLNVRDARTRREYYDDCAYIPIYYGNSRFYSDSDFETFEDQEIIEYDNDFSDDIDEDDDYMES